MFIGDGTAPPPRGGGGYILPYNAYWVCAAGKTPILSPKFPLRSISFSQMTKYSAPEHHHFTFLPFRRPSFSKFLCVQAIHRRPRPAYCSQPDRKAFGLPPQRPGVSGRPECHACSQTCPTKSVPETPLSR